MARISEEEKKRFREIFDDALEKLETPKNKAKKHWNTLDQWTILNRIKEETLELEDALFFESSQKDTESECFDIMIFSLFHVDNMRQEAIK